MVSPASTWKIEHSYVDARGQPQAIDPNTVEMLGQILGNPAMLQDSIVVRRGRVADADAAWQSHSEQRRGILHAPVTAYQPQVFADGARAWLLMAQLYAVRSPRNWGHGDFTDLAQLLRIAAAAGAAGVGLNPLHALAPGQASPYSPSSRCFLNPLYIDIEAIPEFAETDTEGLARDVEKLRGSQTMDYAAVDSIKRRALAATFRIFRNEGDVARRGMFSDFRRDAGAALERYGAFEALRERYGWPWQQWPEQWRSAETAYRIGSEDPDAVAFHCFVQWIAHEQLLSCTRLAQSLGLPTGLYLDIPVGVDPGGADAWSAPHAYVRNLSVGAPPDIYNPRGQDWGLAALHPQNLIDTDFAALRDMLRPSMRYAGAVRLDHALGLNRLFFIPHGLPAAHGGYVSYPFEAMLAAIAEESVTAKCLVIGEDLGTVPEGVSETLESWGIWSCRVGLFERMDNGLFRPPDEFPENALITFNTHDLPSFSGWLASYDLALWVAIGLEPFENETGRESARNALRATLAHHGIAPDLTLPNVLRYLARTRCKLLAVAIDDLAGIDDQPNIPGTTDEHPNWRHRLPIELDEFAHHPALQTVSSVLREEGRHIGRRS